MKHISSMMLHNTISLNDVICQYYMSLNDICRLASYDGIFYFCKA